MCKFLFILISFTYVIGAQATQLDDSLCLESKNTQKNDSNTFSVAARYSPPFIDQTEGPIVDYQGLSWELWTHIKKRLQQNHPSLNIVIKCLAFEDGVLALESGTIDMVISPLTITQQREQLFDFSHQYMNSSLVYAYKKPDSEFNFTAAYSTLTSSLNLDRFLILAGIFISLCAGLFYATYKNLEDYQIADLKQRTWFGRFIHIVVNSILNTSGIRKDVFAFTKTSLQFFSIVILIFGITLSASFFSMLTAALTQSISVNNDINKEDTLNKTMITMKGSTAHKFLLQTCLDQDKSNQSTHEILENCTKTQSMYSSIELADNWLDVLTMLDTMPKSVVIGDWAQLQYLSRNYFPDKLIVQDITLMFEPYGFGLKNNLVYRDEINQYLMEYLRHPAWTSAMEKKFGEGSF
ncbi:substrate-binding periplasmic protein [Marinicellulosiphila megalodicopiae]|uniref:substrate-binding periplasmic protein n=1 Tax=Marinicellulosiphila megalodicopiae TaxID=2724896 RepID=UPI003BAE6A9A